MAKAKTAETETAYVPQTPLPKALVQALPASAEVIKHIDAVARLIPVLEQQLVMARHAGAIPLARAFTVLHRLCERTSEELKPLQSLFDTYKKGVVPEAFEQEGVKNVPLAEGYRVGVSATLYASILGGMKDKAYQWLRGNKLGDLITDTVNSSSLSAAARAMQEENRELPAELFRTALVPNTSVTKI